MSRPKFAYYRSVAHLRNVASLPCQCCGAHGTQAAHSNESRMGKGRAIKASDEFTAALCPRCHSLVDASYSMTRAQREQMWQNAQWKTGSSKVTKRQYNNILKSGRKCSFTSRQLTSKVQKPRAKLMLNFA